jgi:hypothetical protein
VGKASTTAHVAGSRNANDEEHLTGMINILPKNDAGKNSTAYTPIVDSVNELNVQTSVLPAKFSPICISPRAAVPALAPGRDSVPPITTFGIK